MASPLLQKTPNPFGLRCRIENRGRKRAAYPAEVTLQLTLTTPQEFTQELPDCIRSGGSHIKLRYGTIDQFVIAN